VQQLSFLKKTKREHGGLHSVGQRRSRRPINIRQPVHIVLRSEQAHGTRSLFKNKAIALRVLNKFSKRFRIRVYEKAICGNHIHCLVKAQTRRELQNFLRVFAGQVAQEILREFPMSKQERHRSRGGTPSGTRKRSPHPKNQRTFWSLLVYSRIVSWGREYLTVKAYVLQNKLEALGVIEYKVRGARYLKRSEAGDSG
jgi:REP element-mobilizing transposase RayT